jgi:hypothetical protein
VASGRDELLSLIYLMQEAAVCSGDKETGDGVINQLLNPVSDSRRLGRYLAQITAICNGRFIFSFAAV